MIADHFKSQIITDVSDVVYFFVEPNEEANIHELTLFKAEIEDLPNYEFALEFNDENQINQVFPFFKIKDIYFWKKAIGKLQKRYRITSFMLDDGIENFFIEVCEASSAQWVPYKIMSKYSYSYYTKIFDTLEEARECVVNLIKKDNYVPRMFYFD